MRVFFLLCFLFRSSLPKKISCSRISQNSIGKPTVDFCFSCRVYDFISIEIELFSMLSLEFRSSYFSKYLRLIAVIRNSHRRCSIKKAVLKHFAIFTGKHLCWNLLLIDLQTLRQFLRTPILKTSAKGCFCVTLFLSTSIFQFHTKLLHSCSAFVTM